jgi:DNA-binding MarR family transcriptional regulator
VRPPTITRLVDKLEAAGLADRVPDPVDRRISRVEATAKGVKLLHDGRRRRVASLAASLRELPAKERSALSKAVPILERVVRAG